MMNSVDVRFEFERETDGALRYAELNHLGQRIRRLDDGIIGTLYLRKRAVEGIPRIVRAPSILTKHEANQRLTTMRAMTAPESPKFTLPVVVVMALGVAIAAALALASPGSGPVVPATRQPPPVRPSEIQAKPTPVNLDEIPEEAVRAFFDDQDNFFGPDQRLAQIAKKHDGGFGGYSFHKTDRSHVQVYMLDTSKTQSAEAAFREAYNGRRSVTQITPVQGQFRFDQLVEWFPAVDRALLANDIHPTTCAVLEICNRIRFGLRDESLIVDARRVVGDLGIPQEAVVFKQMNPELLADAREPLFRPVIDRFKYLFRSEADDERSFSYGPGRC